jgi:hypothetical protein
MMDAVPGPGGQLITDPPDLDLLIHNTVADEKSFKFIKRIHSVQCSCMTNMFVSMTFLLYGSSRGIYKQQCGIGTER